MGYNHGRLAPAFLRRSIAMKPYTTDTHPEAHRRYVAQVRALTPAQRVAIAFERSQAALDAALRVIERQHPSADEQTLRFLLLDRLYDKTIAERARARSVVNTYTRERWQTMDQGFYSAVVPFADALEDLGVAYYIGGSVASIAYGMPRSTMDVDIVAEMAFHHVVPLVERMRAANYIDEAMMREAIQRRSTFNIIPQRGAVKIDVFISPQRPFDLTVFERLRYLDLDPNAPRPFPLPSAEDIILIKLEWFERSQRASLHQWPDVLGVLQGQHDALDRDYMRRWAGELGVRELLEQAFLDAGV